jgi:hypothetical protein
VFRDFDVMGMLLFPFEANPVLIVDTDAVLAFPIPCQRFQAIAGRDQKIVESLCRIQNGQSAQRYGGDTFEFFDPFPFP